MEGTFYILYCTTPDQKTAGQIADVLVGDKLAACCNIIPGISSVYAWQGKVQKDSECLMLIKTVKSRIEQIKEKITALHPYDVPEIIATPIAAGNTPYLKWIEESTG